MLALLDYLADSLRTRWVSGGKVDGEDGSRVDVHGAASWPARPTDRIL
jgi:hypothetical protein